jgi:hypothetical protein
MSLQRRLAGAGAAAVGSASAPRITSAQDATAARDLAMTTAVGGLVT